jgi:NAD kinase
LIHVCLHEAAHAIAKGYYGVNVGHNGFFHEVFFDLVEEYCDDEIVDAVIGYEIIYKASTKKQWSDYLARKEGKSGHSIRILSETSSVQWES